MKFTQRFIDLISCKNVDEWRSLVFKLGGDLGYEQTRVAILPDPHAPIEAEHAFQHSNYATDWLSKYTEEKFHHVDPTFSHCINKSTPLVWSPEIFFGKKQQEMYEEACAYGVKSGVTLPIHGPRGELGIACFVSDARPDKRFHRDASRNLPRLSCLRDFILESSIQFIKSPIPADSGISVTPRELECIKWCSEGKSSWEIGMILKCSENTVNFHFSNIRRKFGTATRHQAIVKAINLGLISPV